MITFYRYSAVDRLRSPVLVSTPRGWRSSPSQAQKALAFGLNPARQRSTDADRHRRRLNARPLLPEIPTVLRADLYVIAALAGAAVVVIGDLLTFPDRNNNHWRAPLLWAASDGHSPCLAPTDRKMA